MITVTFDEGIGLQTSITTEGETIYDAGWALYYMLKGAGFSSESIDNIMDIEEITRHVTADS